MLDALCFVLFNKPFRKITRSQLVNTINERDTIVECEFRVGQSSYKVVRGIKPNVFEIHRNGTLIDQSACRLVNKCAVTMYLKDIRFDPPYYFIT